MIPWWWLGNAILAHGIVTWLIWLRGEARCNVLEVQLRIVTYERDYWHSLTAGDSVSGKHARPDEKPDQGPKRSEREPAADS